MAFIGGAFLRISQTVLRVIQLLASILVLGIFSYFLAVLKDHDLPIYNRWRAVEGMSGAAVLYGFFCVFLTLCLGGISFFAFIAVVLDICFVGCYIAIAWFTRHGSDKCTGHVITVLGSGNSNSKAAGYGSNGFGFGKGEDVTYLPNLHRACQLEKAVFAVAIVNIVLFLVTAAVQVLLVRHHKKEKRYGPSPANNYTAGSGRRHFWRRNKRNTRDAELATAGAGAGYGDKDRPSHDTSYTGNTLPATQTNPGYAHGNTTTGTNY